MSTQAVVHEPPVDKSTVDTMSPDKQSEDWIQVLGPDPTKSDKIELVIDEEVSKRWAALHSARFTRKDARFSPESVHAASLLVATRA